ncbi:hypothetical protein V8E53_000011 [Lactarius tabidus]
MTRWVAQMGTACLSLAGRRVVVPGAGASNFAPRRMRFSHDDELTRPSYYRVRIDAAEGGSILAEQSTASSVGRLGFLDTHTPYVFLEVTHASDGSSNVAYSSGPIAIEPTTRESADSILER